MFWFFANQKRNSRTAAVRNLLVVTPRSRGTLSTWTKTSSVVNGALLEITLHQRSQNNSSIPQRVKRSRFLFNNPTLERILFSGPSILPVLWKRVVNQVDSDDRSLHWKKHTANAGGQLATGRREINDEMYLICRWTKRNGLFQRSNK